MPEKDPKDGWITLPPNPLYKREYVASCDHGHVTISIPAPGGQLPYGEDAQEIISFMQLIIKQLNRSTLLRAESPDRESVPISSSVKQRVAEVLAERDHEAPNA